LNFFYLKIAFYLKKIASSVINTLGNLISKFKLSTAVSYFIKSILCSSTRDFVTLTFDIDCRNGPRDECDMCNIPINPEPFLCSLY